MPRALPLVLALATTTSGCDFVFRLDEVKPSRDGSITTGDATDGPPPPSCDPDIDITLPLLADTWLSTTPQGMDQTMLAGGGSHTLLTFDRQGYNIASMTLVLIGPFASTECDNDTSTCFPCTHTPGDYEIYLSRTDWTEAGATTATRDGAQAWNAATAVGSLDRTAPLREAFEPPKLVHTRAYDPAMVRPEWDATKIGFHIEASSAFARFSAKEGVDCTGSTPIIPPQLTIRCAP